MACGCVVLLLASAFPRIALFLTWVFTDRIGIAFDGWLLPLAGLIFLPYTTFFYVLAYAPIRGVSGIGWFFVVFGFLLDISSYTGGGRFGQKRYQTA
jgi:hypothetical protein